MKKSYLFVTLFFGLIFSPCATSFAMECETEQQLISFRDLPQELLQIICLYADCKATKNLLLVNREHFELILPCLQYQKELYKALISQNIPRIKIFLNSIFVNENTIINKKPVKDYATQEIEVHTTNTFFCQMHCPKEYFFPIETTKEGLWSPCSCTSCTLQQAESQGCR